ncbi:cobaltochelatase subunit CobN [Vibrio sp.]|nr:cobaltochelatase subunit CobN [Vibrio sp.]
MRYFCMLIVIIWSIGVHAKLSSPNLLLIISQRNAETVSEAIAQFKNQHKNTSVQARTDNQWLSLSANDRHSLLANADYTVGIGLFGAIVAELTNDIRTVKPNHLMIFSSDHRLIQLSQSSGTQLFTSDDVLRHLAATRPSDNLMKWKAKLLFNYPKQAGWIDARSYWQAGGVSNTAKLLMWMAHQVNNHVEIQQPELNPRLQWWFADNYSETLPKLNPSQPIVALIDHSGSVRPSDSQVFKQICKQLTVNNIQCLVALASWGDPSVEAISALSGFKQNLSAIVMLQDFVIGGGEGREKATHILEELNVPIIKGIKLRDRTHQQWLQSSDGIAVDKVYYQVAMPEMQGASQPLIVAFAGKKTIDPQSGLEIQPISNNIDGINTIVERINKWYTLQTKPNSDKKIALIYYNHPPGRHNIGADNLDVPASLWNILQRLKKEGYNVGKLPESQEALLDEIQDRAVNLPNDHHALKIMSPKITHVTQDDYNHYFSTLPSVIQKEMIEGPFGRLNEQMKSAVGSGSTHYAQQLLSNTMEEMFHLVEGVDHPARQRALELLGRLRQCYQSMIDNTDQLPCWTTAEKIITSLRTTGIEALGGWGEVPGNIMVMDTDILIPGIQFGNVFISPQPPRGWEINEELLHANLAFPPTHQYLAYYHFLRDEFKADAFVHLGRHSTYEFLPHRSVGLANDDYSRIIASDVPGIYPYIVDGVGEGIQAKRRGLAVMIDHLTPPLESTPLYDDLLQLRQLVESYEANHDSNNKALTQSLITQIRSKVDSLNLKEELTQSMSAELEVRGISFDEVDDAMLVHEIGHYLTNLQEQFMPYGLHIFGKPWHEKAINMMLSSMTPKGQQLSDQTKHNLISSPEQEMKALLNGLNGHFIAPGKGNDPIRSPESLPTGRNFYALDNSLIPSQIAWKLGKQMAEESRQANPIAADKREALILWASDVVRDEGVMIAFALDMLGLEPQWNSRGLVKSLKWQALTDGRKRRDFLFTTSGLFRDLYGQQMHLLDNAVLMALDASAKTIIQQYPALTELLNLSLKPLGKVRKDGEEPLEQNLVAAHWVSDARKQLASGFPINEVAQLSTLRIFGDAPGSYGAGVNRLVERSGAWQQRKELADVYMRRLGHGYSQSEFGVAAEDTFRHLLSNVDNTYFGRSSNLYGLIDNNDAFDYLGGLSLAVETLSGKAPNNYVIDHSNPDHVTTEKLGTALRQELRGRFLNPEWLKGLMQHGYAGARTMGSEFLEYLWGWQVTNPTLVGDWAWEEVKSVYLDDRYNLKLNQFLEQGNNAHVKANMLAIMLVAIYKDFWHADETTIQQIAKQFVDLVKKNGLPGSGHTTPEHPMMPWLEQHLSAEDWQYLSKLLEQEKRTPEHTQEVHSAKEITVKQQEKPAENEGKEQQTSQQTEPNILFFALAFIMLVIVAFGFYRSMTNHQRLKGK